MRSLLFAMAAIAAGLQIPAFGQSALNLTPSRVVGQPALTFRSTSPNVVEGREFFNPYSVVVDRSSTPAPVYVADLGNNRVLGWRDSSRFSNGATADIVIGQLDKVSTLPQGPGTPRTAGLSAPTGLAVDSRGNLYIADAGNNRILRFPKPFASSADVLLPDMVIGQPSLTSSAVNNGGISNRTVALNSNGIGRGDLAFDPQGNLWFTDTLNNRVLRYPAAALNSGENGPAADVVLGQPDFSSNSVPTQASGSTPLALNKAILRNPVGITVDPDGRVYVSDTLGRVLAFTPPYFNGKEASRIAGISVQQQNQPPQYEFILGGPQGLFMVGSRLGVADPALHRLAIYDPFNDWPSETETQISPVIRTIIGQPSVSVFQANRGQAEPSETSLAAPFAGFYTGTELFVADTGNNRVLVFPQVVNNLPATRVLGQTAFNFNGANLVEGRELYLYNGFSSSGNLSGNFSDGSGIAIDTQANPPHLYIADTFNNRILGFRDVRRVRPGDKADIVIGQTDLMRVLANSPTNNRDLPNDTGLYRPSGLAVDANGDLYVADSGNGRVLRFPKPFDQTIPAGERPRANLVIGQQNFFQKITDASARNMAYPFGVAFTVEGHLLVSDAIHSRILFFRRPANGDFQSGQAAEKVIGQPDFFTTGSGNATNRMNSPRHIALDTDDRLYVADAGNSRVLVYDRITVGGNDPSPAFVLTGVNNPQGIFVSALTGEIWVTNTRGNAAVRFPQYQRLAIDPRSDYSIPSSAPLALTQDSSGNLYVAEGSNRVAIFYNGLAFQIAGNYASRPLSPGSIATLYPAGSGVNFGDGESSFSSLPLPTVLGDIQVLLNEQPVPLYYVNGPRPQINFLVPMSAPDSGTGELQVVRQSTGQILAVSNVRFDRVSPALFVQGGALQGQLAALNQDNTINSPSNPAAKGTVIQLFGTGQGFVPNAPPDGTAPTGPVETQFRPRVLIEPDYVKDEDIQYSGLAPGLVGVWQINVRIPENVAPGTPEVVVLLNSVPTNVTGTNSRIRTTIAVKP